MPDPAALVVRLFDLGDILSITGPGVAAMNLLTAAELAEIEARQRLEYLHGGGTKVTNCVLHSGPLTNRPTDCSRCAQDAMNRLSDAIRANEWLNEQLDHARTDLPRAVATIRALAEALDWSLSFVQQPWMQCSRSPGGCWGRDE